MKGLTFFVNYYLWNYHFYVWNFQTLIFCKTVAECTSIYKTMRRALDKDFTEPLGYPDYHQFCLVDMYTRVSEKKKEKVFRSFMTAGSKLRILITTTAFSLGVDFPVMLFTMAPLLLWNSTCKRPGELDEMEVFPLLYCMESLESM